MIHTLAQINATTLPSYFPPAKNFGTIGSVTNIVVPAIMLVATLTFLAMIFYGAYTLLTSQGEAEALTSARSTIIWGIVGLLIMMLSYFIVKVIGYILQVPIPF